MSLKTSCGYNEDDFVEVDKDLKELTVTITLCEYRSLIREQAQAAKEIELLQDKLKKAQESGNAMLEVLLRKSPAAVKKIAELYDCFFSNGEKEEVVEE